MSNPRERREKSEGVWRLTDDALFFFLSLSHLHKSKVKVRKREAWEEGGSGSVQLHDDFYRPARLDNPQPPPTYTTPKKPSPNHDHTPPSPAPPFCPTQGTAQKNREASSIGPIARAALLREVRRSSYLLHTLLFAASSRIATCVSVRYCWLSVALLCYCTLICMTLSDHHTHPSSVSIDGHRFDGPQAAV
ncbi:hypothetical protein HDV57DRAFT_106264 [Trichoderma longibrachiatum]